MELSIKQGHSAETILPLLKDILKAQLVVKGRIAKPIFKDSIRTGVLEPIEAVAALYIDGAPVAWVATTEASWRTGVDDSGERTEDEQFWRFTHPKHRRQGYYKLLRHCVNGQEVIKTN